MRLKSLLFALFLTPVVYGDSIGVYAPVLLTNAPAAVRWEKYTRPAVSTSVSYQIQATYDRLCERVDLMSTNYVYAEDKHDLVLPGCPSPAVRTEAVTDPDRGLSGERYARFCTAVGDWLHRDPSVETTTSTTNAIYPDWQSPLCMDIGLSAGPEGLKTANADRYPAGISRFRGAGTNRTDVADALERVAEEIGIPYENGTNDYSVPNLDARFCSFVSSGRPDVRYVDDMLGDGTNAVLSWNAIQSVDRICAEASSGNVATRSFAGITTNTLSQRQTIHYYYFDRESISAWLLATCASNGVSVFFAADNGISEYPFDPVTAETPSVGITAQHGATATRGYVKRTASYTPIPYDEAWQNVGNGSTGHGHYWAKYRRRLYGEEASVAPGGTVTFNAYPAYTLYVMETGAGVSLPASDVFSANAAFSEHPEYFDRTQLTLLASETTEKQTPQVGVHTTNTVLSSYASCVTNPCVTSVLTNGFRRMFALSADDLSLVATSAVPLTVTLDPVGVTNPVDVCEYRTTVYGVSGVLHDYTFAARDDGGDHFPKIQSDDTLAPPDASAGESWATGYIPDEPRTAVVRQPFYSVYEALTNGSVFRVAKTFSNPVAVYENRYKFSSLSDKADNAPIDAIGPTEDYGDGDGGLDDFDVFVDASYSADRDTTGGRTFRTLDAAVAAVNPKGGACAVTNRIPKIGIFPGDYDLPAFFSVRPFMTSTVVPPYDVRLIGIGKGVTIHRAGRYITGRYVIIKQEGEVYYTIAYSRMENLTLDMGTGQRIDYLTAFSLYNCAITGTIRYRDSVFADCVLSRCRVDAAVSCYNDTSYKYQSWYRRPPIFNGAIVDGSLVFLTTTQGYYPPLINQYSGIYDSVLTCDSLDSLQAGGTTSDPVFSGSTIRVLSAGNLNNTLIPLAATNCLFFVTGLEERAPQAVDNVMTNAALYGDAIDPKTFKPRDSHADWRRHGFHNYIYPR